MRSLGRLEKVELREAWPTEAQDFTPWLATPENISVLGDTLGLDLEVQDVESNVGPYRADIVCRELLNESKVLIENQLEKTDHGHLGQLITYAAGTEAATIVWISAQFTEEHRAALDWLNEHTRENIQFFGIQIELWSIESSSPAPRFNIVSKPNNWTRAFSRSANELGRPMTEMRELQHTYWARFKTLLEDRNYPGISIRTPQARSWITFSIGRTGFCIATATNTFENWVKAELYIGNDSSKNYFHQLHADAHKIEEELGEPLSWEEMPDKKASRIALYLKDANPTDDADWPRQHDWIATRLTKLHTIFEPRIKTLNVDDAD